jgi:hypothetical protein
MKNQTNLESMLEERLNELKVVPARNSQAAARGRARFLAQARAASEAQRNKGWGFLLFRKQQFALNLAVALVMIVGLFAGGGTTVYAAQDDLPNEPLYGIKTFSEDISLQLENDPEAKADRLLELTQTRIQEMSQLVRSGQTPPEKVRVRLEQHLQETLQIFSNMEDAKLDQELLKLREQLQQHEREMQALQENVDQPVIEHTRTMLQAQLQLVNEGLANHEVLRNAVQNGFVYETTQTPPAPSPTPYQEQNGQATPEPKDHGNGNGVGPHPEPGGPNASMTPTPHSGNNGNGTNPGNNAGGNDKDNGKDKDPKDNDPGNGNNGNGKGPK